MGMITEKRKEEQSREREQNKIKMEEMDKQVKTMN